MEWREKVQAGMSKESVNGHAETMRNEGPQHMGESPECERPVALWEGVHRRLFARMCHRGYR